MPASDIHMLRLKDVKAFLMALDRRIPPPGKDIVLIGGAAVTLLCALFSSEPALNTEEVLRRAGLV